MRSTFDMRLSLNDTPHPSDVCEWSFRSKKTASQFASILSVSLSICPIQEQIGRGVGGSLDVVRPDPRPFSKF
jgi:hypothetical protein